MHAHPINQIPGCSGVIPIQTDGGHGAEANLFYVADTTYTDRGATGVPALTGRTQVVLQPKHKQAEYHNGASGVRVVSQAGAEAGARIGDIDNNDWISFTPVNLTGIYQVSFRVSSPTGGGSIELRAGSPTGALVASAPVTSTGGWDTYANLPPVPVTRPSGTTELFAVFKMTTNRTFDLDSIRYVGQGVGQGGARQIVGVGGKCVDVNGASPADGAKVQLWTCNGQANQQWAVSGSTIRSLGKCLDVNAGGTADGTIVQLWTCNGTAAQNWTVQADGTIRNGGKCLDATGGSSANGTQLIIWTCGGGANQRWTLT